MINQFDLQKYLKDLKDKANPDIYWVVEEYQLGAEWLIYSVNDQLNLIKDYNLRLMKEALTSENSDVLELSALINIAEFILSGVVLPWGGVKVDVFKSQAARQEFMLSIQHRDIKAITEKGKLGQPADPNFTLKLYFSDITNITKGVNPIDLSIIQYVQNPKSNFKCQTLAAMTKRLNQLIEINTGFGRFVPYDGEKNAFVFANIPYAASNSNIIVTLQDDGYTHLQKV